MDGWIITSRAPPKRSRSWWISHRHLLFAKQRAVAVELFSGTLINLRKGGGLWFFARYTKGYYGKIFLDRGPRQERSTLDAVQAVRVMRCASEASAGPRAKRPSCDK